MEKENVQCKCDNEEVSKVCKRPFYDAFDTCLICNHNKVCHEDKD